MRVSLRHPTAGGRCECASIALIEQLGTDHRYRSIAEANSQATGNMQADMSNMAIRATALSG